MTDVTKVDSTEAESEKGFSLSRRGFFAASGGVAAAALVFAACSSDDSDSSSGSGGGSSSSKKNVDLDTAAFAASLEVLAVNTYKAALDAATANKLGPVPAAGATFVQTAMVQHQAHLDRWNSVLQQGGRQAVTAPDMKLKATVDTEFAKVTDFGGAAKLARTLERIAAATYQKAIPTLTSGAAIETAGSINIIDMQHVAVLNFVLGEYPVPDTFAKTEMAASPS